MKFKHSFHVFVDNFSAAYKLLLYKLIVCVVAAGIFYVILSPVMRALSDAGFWDNVKNFLNAVVYGEKAGDANETLNVLANQITDCVGGGAQIAAIICPVIVVYLVEEWFFALGNYAVGSLINDKMALRANSSLILTLVRHLKDATVYASMYVPLSILYNAVVGTAIFFFVFYGMFFIPILVQVFLFTLIFVIAIVIKMTFTSDWLPALIAGKKKYGEAMRYTFSRRGKQTANVMSNFAVLVLLIFAINVGALLLTFGAGLLLTIPSSFLLLISFEFVNYYEREELKFFIDKNTVIKPDKERLPSREEFFKGEK